MALSLGVGGGPVVHLSGVFEKLLDVWKKIFSFEERRPRPRRGGQDPGWLSGKKSMRRDAHPLCYYNTFIISNTKRIAIYRLESYTLEKYDREECNV